MPFPPGALNQKIEVNGLDLLLLDSSVNGKTARASSMGPTLAMARRDAGGRT